jgi:hypothetical protein
MLMGGGVAEPGDLDGKGYPRAERGRRVLWRTVSIGIYVAIGVFSFWLAERQGWNLSFVLAATAVPYWLVVTAIWRRRGPYMPRLHGPRATPPP